VDGGPAGNPRMGGCAALRYTLAALVENHFGVLARVAGLISRRGFNIESLAVGPTQTPGLARMTIVLAGEAEQREQMVRQLGKLVDVLSVQALEEETLVARELALCKVHCPPEARPAVLQMAEVFRARVVDAGSSSLTLEVTGTEDKITAMIGLMEEYGVAEVARTGRVALARGERQLRAEVG
jgi:acetolactate synthase-1/3 small subunit